jgi:hypothetical protein
MCTSRLGRIKNSEVKENSKDHTDAVQPALWSLLDNPGGNACAGAKSSYHHKTKSTGKVFTTVIHSAKYILSNSVSYK